ncbi:hypothetical protein JWZ98_23040 (plasmid) [Methylomonas sp. EFPC1]|uniref:hypothetical protein n=1 Tax=Methylomonas sp. EFPC1 TaxID=2812647 RepID=UPI0019682655|nr:hypothetical protein [Methylomonas sp. EFPC1]QSB03788.1 hypothetical protein JWZ98_23040 [Methylomonas sp. EFPC1]
MEQTDEREKNQQQFRQILSTYNITQAKAAALISRELCKTVNVRAVRAWLARADATTATPCPMWAIVALKRATQKLSSTQDKTKNRGTK